MKCRIIAEIGQNHEGNFELLKTLSESAIKSGADSIKFQYWNVDFVYDKKDIRYEAAKKRELNFDQLLEYIKELDQRKIFTILSFFGLYDDKKIQSMDFKYLMSKVPSSQINNFLSSAFTNHACFVSLGYFKGYYNSLPPKPIYFACQPQYPTLDPYPSLLQLIELKRRFLHVGYSCHYKGLEAAKAAILLRANYIEKHFTFDRLKKKSTFRDHVGSMTPNELIELIEFRDQTFKNGDPDFISTVNGLRELKTQ